MENEFLYRYIGFETFVDMVQQNALTFVLPYLWEDPKEESPFLQLVGAQGHPLKIAFFIALHNKAYAQSWSELAESDAMWRIYSYSNRALRIKIKKSNVNLLDNVTAIPVKYSDEPFDSQTFDENEFLHSLAYKRTAFCHEREVRLISHYKYKDEQDAKQHINAVYVIHEHPDRIKIAENMFPNLEIEEQIDRIVELLNVGKKQKQTKKISYEHIPNFIEGVLVHPLAPSWYVEVIEEYCKRNNITFEGQSKLYSQD